MTKNTNVKREKKKSEFDVIQPLLDRLSGGQACEIAQRLREDPDALDDIVRDISTGSEIEIMLKLARTQTRDIAWETRADFDYVGLPGQAEEYQFRVAFEKYIKPLLGKRADGFSAIFDALDHCSNPFIVETGSLRVPKNWEGDGQSTFQFDWYAREKRGSVTTIDINPMSIDSARRACSSVTSAILNDSVATLEAIGARTKQPASLIYLDSFDLDLADPMPSAMHHAMEVMAAKSLIGPGTILCIDDFNVSPLGPGGKGLIVDKFMSAINAEILHEGYQKIWRVAR